MFDWLWLHAPYFISVSANSQQALAYFLAGLIAFDVLGHGDDRQGGVEAELDGHAGDQGDVSRVLLVGAQREQVGGEQLAVEVAEGADPGAALLGGGAHERGEVDLGGDELALGGDSSTAAPPTSAPASSPTGAAPAAKAEALFTWLEGWVDFIDGARRHGRAKQVMQDLIDQRISHPRAAQAMRELDARAKGGWLVKAMRRDR